MLKILAQLLFITSLVAAIMGFTSQFDVPKVICMILSFVIGILLLFLHARGIHRQRESEQKNDFVGHLLWYATNKHVAKDISQENLLRFYNSNFESVVDSFMERQDGNKFLVPEVEAYMKRAALLYTMEEKKDPLTEYLVTYASNKSIPKDTETVLMFYRNNRQAILTSFALETKDDVIVNNFHSLFEKAAHLYCT